MGSAFQFPRISFAGAWCRCKVRPWSRQECDGKPVHNLSTWHWPPRSKRRANPDQYLIRTRVCAGPAAPARARRPALPAGHGHRRPYAARQSRRAGPTGGSLPGAARPRGHPGPPRAVAGAGDADTGGEVQVPPAVLAVEAHTLAPDSHHGSCLAQMRRKTGHVPSIAAGPGCGGGHCVRPAPAEHRAPAGLDLESGEQRAQLHVAVTALTCCGRRVAGGGPPASAG
jgi:hypothetical protein